MMENFLPFAVTTFANNFKEFGYKFLEDLKKHRIDTTKTHFYNYFLPIQNL